MLDGHLNICKSCTKICVKKHRGKNLETIRAYDRSRGSRGTAEQLRDYRARYPNKYKAHLAISNGLRSGKVVKELSCSCGKPSEHAHHDDYSKPLEVRWVCAACHHIWHAKYGEALNP